MQFEQFDDSYVARLRQGDPEVEAHFTAYFGQLILLKMRRRLRSREAIEDVRQDTFARVFQALRTPDGVRQPERLGAFVNAVCDNVYREKCRQRPVQPLPDEAAVRADGSPDPLSGIISEEERQAVRRIVADLSPRDRAVLKAVYLDETERAALCAELKVDRDYLRVLVHRAKEAFRQRAARGPRSAGAGPQPRSS